MYQQSELSMCQESDFSMCQEFGFSMVQESELSMCRGAPQRLAGHTRSTLAGFARAPSGRDLAFAIFCGDLERRGTFDTSQETRPPGARGYNGRAKQLQQALIERWAAVHG